MRGQRLTPAGAFHPPFHTSSATTTAPLVFDRRLLHLSRRRGGGTPGQRQSLDTLFGKTWIDRRQPVHWS
jgi:hypothetical protein